MAAQTTSTVGMAWGRREGTTPGGASLRSGPCIDKGAPSRLALQCPPATSYQSRQPNTARRRETAKLHTYSARVTARN
jgi:hypothetical protein